MFHDGPQTPLWSHLPNSSDHSAIKLHGLTWGVGIDTKYMVNKCYSLLLTSGKLKHDSLVPQTVLAQH